MTGRLPTRGRTVLLGLLLLCATASQAVAQIAVFPVKDSGNGRYLTDQNGIPFPIKGRTAWAVTSLTATDYRAFIDDTVSRGYNAIEIMAIVHDTRGNHAPLDGNGDPPFLKRLDGTTWEGFLCCGAPDFTTPNEAYWSSVDGFLSYCESKGILVFMFPAYVGWQGGSQGWMQEMLANGPSKVQSYGAWIATRYKNQKNLVWMMGGDMGTGSYTFNSSQTDAENALLTGLKSVTGQQSTFFSAEWAPESIATDQTSFGASMTLSAIYSYSGDVSNQGRRAYAYSPAEPAFLEEGPYDEEGPDGNNTNPAASQPVRRFQWWGWLSTIGGYISGNGYVWPFVAPAWLDHLDTQGSRDMARLNAFIGSIAWYDLVPSGLSGMRTLITSGGSSVDFVDYAAAAATPTGTLLVVYLPPAHSGPISVDMSAMSGPARARWFDPTSGTYTVIGTGLANSGTRSFSTIGSNSAGESDWVLVLDTPDSAPPTISSASPNLGWTTGGTSVTLTGSNFVTGASVSFGGAAASNVVVVSSTTVTATTPAHAAGTVSVTVTNPDTQAGTLNIGFTYVSPTAPTVGSVTPSSGSTLGGTAVTVAGTNFAAGASVTFGGTTATNITVVTNSSITATTPVHAAGPIAVVVTNPNTESGTLSNAFTYISTAPLISSVTPNTGPTTGGTTITIGGSNFVNGATVTIGGTPATNITVVSGISITATTPAHAAGTVNVVVTNPDTQSGALTNGFMFGSATQPISFIQLAAAVPQSSPTSVAVAYPAAQAAGDLNVVVVGLNDSASTVSSVRDSATNVYSLAIGPTTGTGLRQSIYYASNIAGGANTVTVTFNQATPSPDVRILQYRGVSSLDVTAGASGSGNAASSGAATTSAPNELIVGANTVAYLTTAAGSGFTSRIITSPNSDIAEDSIVSAVGSYSATATLTGSSAWVMQLATFKAGGAAPGPAPTISTVVPNSGSTLGGTSLTITGTNFVSGATVTVGGVAATNVVVVSGTSITARTAAHAAGAANVLVTNPDLQVATLTNGFTYVLTAPTVGSILPNSGSSLGGTDVTITGTNFVSGAAVTVGGVAATSVVVVSGTSITAKTPAHPAGTVIVTVTNPNNETGSLNNAFTYISATMPTVGSVAPNSGSTIGGTGVTITGTNFVTGASVSMGGIAATNVIAVNNTSITVTSPAHAAGAVTVTVTNPNTETGSLTNGFTYISTAPTVTSISPNSGSSSGGTNVTIGGTNFVTGATVTIGGTPATNVIIGSGTSLTATTPAHAAGAATVTVTNPDTQTGSLTNGFAYGTGAISFVRVAAADPQSSPTAVSVAYPAAQIAGNLNVVVVGWNNATSAVSSVMDSANNVYSLAIGPTTGTGLRQSIYYASTIRGGSNTVTVTFNQVTPYPDVRILEYSGVTTLDVVAGTAGSGNAASSGAATTTAANELIVGASTVANLTTAAGTGFTSRIITSPDSDIAEDRIVTTAGSYSATATLTGNAAWVMQMATFK